MQRKRQSIAFAAVLVFCLAAVAPAALAAPTVQLAPPESVDAMMGAPTKIRLPWSKTMAPAPDTDFSAWTCRTVRAEGPDVAWGPVTSEGVEGTVTLPGTPGARATYYYTVEVLDGTQKIGDNITFQFDAFAPQIKAVSGVQPVTGAAADVQVVWSEQAKPAEGTDFSKWTVVSESEDAPEITWGALSAEGAAGTLPVPPDAETGAKYEYRVEVREGNLRVGNPATLTAVVEREDTAFLTPQPVAAVPGTTASITMQWQKAYKPQEENDLEDLRVLAQSEDEHAPSIAWEALTVDGTTGAVEIPADAAGQTYEYLVGVLDGDKQLGAAVTLQLVVASPKLQDTQINVTAGTPAEVLIPWAENTGLPQNADLSALTLKAQSENGPEAALDLTADGATGTVQIPEDAAADTKYEYVLTILAGETQVGEPATLTLTVLCAQLAQPEPLPAPPAETTEFTLTWEEGRRPSAAEDLTKWTVESENVSGPKIEWGAVTEQGVSGKVTMSASAIQGVRYTYTVKVTSDGSAIVGEPVTLTIVVGESIAPPVSIDPQSVEISPGAPPVTVTAYQEDKPATEGWWSLELGAPEGTTLETLGITNHEANPLEIKTEENTPVGTYTLVYNKDTQSAQTVVIIRVDDTAGALVTLKPASELSIVKNEAVDAYLILQIPISATQQVFTEQMLMEQLIVPEGMTLGLQTRDGAAVPEGSAVATGMAVDVLDNGEVAERLYTVVQGDVMGTGMMTLTQLVRMARAYTGTEPLETLYNLAGDFSGSGTITLSDLIREAKLLIQFS